MLAAVLLAINQSVTIVEQAGAEIADVRNRIMAYDGDGNVVLAADGSVVIVTLWLICTPLKFLFATFLSSFLRILPRTGRTISIRACTRQ